MRVAALLMGFLVVATANDCSGPMPEWLRRWCENRGRIKRAAQLPKPEVERKQHEEESNIVTKTMSQAASEFLQKYQLTCQLLESEHPSQHLSRPALDVAFRVADENSNGNIDPLELDLFENLLEALEICSMDELQKEEVQSQHLKSPLLIRLTTLSRATSTPAVPTTPQ